MNKYHLRFLVSVYNQNSGNKGSASGETAGVRPPLSYVGAARDTMNPLTLEEFLTLPETKPASEFINGEIVQKPMPQESIVGWGSFVR